MAAGMRKAAGNTNSSQDLFAPNSFWNKCNSNHNPFAPNAFGNTSNYVHNFVAPYSIGNTSNSNHNPFGNTSNSNHNPFGNTSNYGHNFVAPNSIGNTSNSNHNPFGNTSTSAHNLVAPDSIRNTRNSNAFGNTRDFHHNAFSPNAFGNTSNSIHNPFSPNLFGIASNSMHNPFSSNAFGNNSSSIGNTCNSNHDQFAPSSIGNTCNSNHDQFAANALGTTTSTYGGHPTGVFGVLPASLPKFTFGQPASFLGSSSMSETTNTKSHGPFGSTTSRGPFGSMAREPFCSTAKEPFGSTARQPFGSSRARGRFEGPPPSGFWHESTVPSGSSAVAGLASNKSNIAFSFKPFKSEPASQTTRSNLVQTNSHVHPSKSSSSAASPSLPAGLVQPLGGQNTGSRIKSYKHTILKGSECKLISISAMPFYEDKSHEELRWEDYELKSEGLQNSVDNQAVRITKRPFQFPLPSVCSSLNFLSPPCTAPAFSLNMNINPTSSIPCPLSSDPSPIFPVSYNKTPASTGSGCDQVAASNSNNQPLQRLQLPPIESGRVQETASNPWLYNRNSMIHVTAPLTAPPISAGNNDGVSSDMGQIQPSVPQQNSIVDGVKESITAVKDPFGSEHTTSQQSIVLSASSFFRHGISSLPVVDEPAKSRVSSVLTSRHRSPKPLAVNVRKYYPTSDVPKVPFFDRVDEIQNKSKAYSYIMPRENPRAVLTVSSELTHVSTSKNEASPLNYVSAEQYGQDKPTKAYDNAREFNKQLIPKLQRSDYYTEPKIEKLASNERLDPGYCCRVKDFVVGRVGYGWVKFYGETDVRGLDLDSHIQFNSQEVIVYDEDCEKPPVGKGLNKAAEVTLLNIKCIDNKTGKQYISGSMVDNFIQKLKKLVEKQGAQFVSYDSVKGEWKFSVQHF